MTTGIRIGEWVYQEGIGPCQITDVQLRVGAPAECAVRFPAIQDKGIVLKWAQLDGIPYTLFSACKRPALLPGEDDI